MRSGYRVRPQRARIAGGESCRREGLAAYWGCGRVRLGGKPGGNRAVTGFAVAVAVAVAVGQTGCGRVGQGVRLSVNVHGRGLQYMWAAGRVSLSGSRVGKGLRSGRLSVAGVVRVAVGCVYARVSVVAGLGMRPRAFGSAGARGTGYRVLFTVVVAWVGMCMACGRVRLRVAVAVAGCGCGLRLRDAVAAGQHACYMHAICNWKKVSGWYAWQCGRLRLAFGVHCVLRLLRIPVCICLPPDRIPAHPHIHSTFSHANAHGYMCACTAGIMLLRARMHFGHVSALRAANPTRPQPAPQPQPATATYMQPAHMYWCACILINVCQGLKFKPCP